MKTLAENFPALANFLYHTSIPTEKRIVPLQVICVGISRSGTESLQRALILLSYNYTYHGFDVSTSPGHCEGWTQLALKKYSQASGIGGESCLTAADFDPIIGHCTAITDMPAAVFAKELIDAYPDAKVILNTRADLDKWYESVEATFGQTPIWTSFGYLQSYFCASLFWRRLVMLESFYNFFYGDFHATGKWRYRAHSDEIRGLLAKQPERMLEWKVEDGWEPLCAFLGKEVPKEDFPNGNPPKDFAQRLARIHAANFKRANRNMMLCGGLLAGISTALLWGIGWVPGWAI